MALFSSLFQRVIRWASHRRAPYFLAGISIAESAVLPFPTDILLAPMVYAKPESAWRFAFLATLGSLLGALIGYGIGYFAFDAFLEPLIDRLGYIQDFEKLDAAFTLHGVWLIFVAALIPLPFKLFTISAGMFGMGLPEFLLAACLGRGIRYFVISILSKKYGMIIEEKLITFLDKIQWILLLGLIAGIVAYTFW